MNRFSTEEIMEIIKEFIGPNCEQVLKTAVDSSSYKDLSDDKLSDIKSCIINLSIATFNDIDGREIANSLNTLRTFANKIYNGIISTYEDNHFKIKELRLTKAHYNFTFLRLFDAEKLIIDCGRKLNSEETDNLIRGINIMKFLKSLELVTTDFTYDKIKIDIKILEEFTIRGFKDDSAKTYKVIVMNNNIKKLIVEFYLEDTCEYTKDQSREINYQYKIDTNEVLDFMKTVEKLKNLET